MSRRWVRFHLTLAAAILVLAWPAPAAAQDGGQRFKARQFQADYRTILSVYAAGDLDGALEQLSTLESAIVEREGKRVIEVLWRSKLRVVQGLLSGPPEILVPISQLHQAAYLRYLEMQLQDLAVHSRLLTVELARILADRSRGRELDQRASRILTSMAAHLQKAFMESTAAQLYDRALEIDPENEVAMLGLAALRERHGDYAVTAELLEQLVRIVPENFEGHLRLGVNLARLGRYEEAEETLRLVADSPAPDWVLSVAYQELARTLSSTGQNGAASKLLEAAIVRLPGDATLPIQAAYLTDRQTIGPGDETLERALIEQPKDFLRSPRLIYSQMPQRSLQEMRAVLLAETNQGLPVLRRVLTADRRTGA